MSKEEFPELPKYEYETAPIYLEPTEGSGERITVCVAACGIDGRMAASVINEVTAQYLFGSGAPVFLGLVETIRRSADSYLKKGGNLSGWAEYMPVSGVSLGDVTIARAESVVHAMDMTARHHAFLYRVPGE